MMTTMIRFNQFQFCRKYLPNFISRITISVKSLWILITILIGIVSAYLQLSGTGTVRKRPVNAWNESWWWWDCNPTFHNRTIQLYEDLKDILAVFKAHNVSHVVAYGTLLGVMRHQGMNPYEVDNDIHILEDSLDGTFTPELHRDLYDRGLILFPFASCYRICRRLDHGRKWGIWEILDIFKQNLFFLYTDIGFGIPEGAEELFEKTGREIVYRKLDTIYAPTPNDQVTEHWLTSAYGDWRTPPPAGTTKWRQKLA